MTAQKGAQIMGRPCLCLSLQLKVFVPVWVGHNWRKFGAKRKSPFFYFLRFLVDQGDYKFSYNRPAYQICIKGFLVKRAILGTFFEVIKSWWRTQQFTTCIPILFWGVTSSPLLSSKSFFKEVRTGGSLKFIVQNKVLFVLEGVTPCFEIIE